jgi:hypothetical protein
MLLGEECPVLESSTPDKKREGPGPPAQARRFKIKKHKWQPRAPRAEHSCAGGCPVDHSGHLTDLPRSVSI